MRFLERKFRHKPGGLPVDKFLVQLEEQEIDVNENTLEYMSNFLCCRDGRVLSVKYTSEKRATEDTKDSFLNMFVSSNVFN